MGTKSKYTMCRLCLSKKECYTDIFKLNDSYDYVPASVISDLLHYEVSKLDGYPHVICNPCLAMLTEIRNFKEQCQISKITYDKIIASDENFEDCHSEEVDMLPVKAESITVEVDQQHIAQLNRLNIKLKRKTAGQDQNEEDGLSDDQEGSGGEDRGESANVEVYIDKYDPWEEYQRQHEPQCEIQEDIPSTSMNYGGKTHNRQYQNEIFSAGEYLENYQLNHHGAISSTTVNNHLLHYYDSPIELPGNEPAVCDLCGKSFSSKGHLERHKRAKLCLQEFRCTVCGKYFPRKRNLLKHMMTHSADKPYKCEFCNKGFNSSYHRSRHQVIHTGERRFVCQNCNRSFTRKDKYNLHLRTPCTEAAFQCNLCDAVFPERRALLRHVGFHRQGVQT